MQEIKLCAKDRCYSIYCGNNIYKDIADLFDLRADKICIITDSNVAPLHLDNIKKAMAKPAFHYIIEAGEASKTIHTCIDIYNFLAQNHFTKTDLLIALGGGVCGDLAGFVAATYLRGIRYYSVPTTLLAMVDSSIGGKCGADIPYGKNLVGAIYQPYGVLIDTLFLNTLSQSVFNDGMAEVIKYGFIYDRSIYDKSINNLKQNIEQIIFRCAQIKTEIVQKDEFDSNLRMILNFGHTIGHAIEKLGAYSRYSHGQAVAIGMAYAAKLSQIYTAEYENLYDDVLYALNKLNLPVKTDYSHKEIIDAVRSDKKNREGKLNFILLKKIGSAAIYSVDGAQVHDFIKPCFEEA